MHVVFQSLGEPGSPVVVTADGELKEIWPVVVELTIAGKPAPLRFAWDRYHRILRVDERWGGRSQLGDIEAKRRCAEVALEVIKRAANAASEN